MPKPLNNFFVFGLFFILNYGYIEVESQCFTDNDISIYHQSGYSSFLYQETSNQCLGNFTFFNENYIDDEASRGITCSRKDSTAEGEWTFNGMAIMCDNDALQVTCTRNKTGSITLYTHFQGEKVDWLPHQGNYTCCIDGLCITARIYQHDIFNELFPNIADAVIETCTVSLSTDITVVPQQYIVQMNTSGVPPVRISSFINCTNGSGITCGESYYTLVDLQDERYQFTVPVTWDPSVDTAQYTNHYYDCSVKFGGGGADSDDDPNTYLSSSKTIQIKSPSVAPFSIKYTVINTTAINVMWNYTGDVVNGFVINITSSTGLADNTTVTKQITGGEIRESIITDLLRETNYTIAVRGYHDLLGPLAEATALLDADIYSIDGSLLSVSSDLNIQEIQVNCYSYRVKPSEVTWLIDSSSVDKNLIISSGSELLNSTDQTYRNFIILKESFNIGSTIECRINVNGQEKLNKYELKGAKSIIQNVTAEIISSSSILVSWNPVSSVSGYIIQYYDEEPPIIVSGANVSNYMLEGLTKGINYRIIVLAYAILPFESVLNSIVSIKFEVPELSSLMISTSVNDPSAISITWSVSNDSVAVNYSLEYTRLCDNTSKIIFFDGSINNTILTNLLKGLQYSVAVTPINFLGPGETVYQTLYLEAAEPPSESPFITRLTAINASSIELQWEDRLECAQRNGNITGYVVQYSLDNIEHKLTVIGDYKLSVVLSGVFDGQILISVAVAAMNNIGTGPFHNITIEIMIPSIICDNTNTSNMFNGLQVAGISIGFLIVIVFFFLSSIVVGVLICKRSQRNAMLIENHQSKEATYEQYTEMEAIDDSKIVKGRIGKAASAEQEAIYEPVDN